MWRIPHPLVAHMQKTPDEVRAGGAEPIRSLSDRLRWKCKTSDLRAIVTKLTPTELAALGVPESAAWWGGAAGVRRDDSASDFYRQLHSETLRHGRGTGKPSSSHLLPQQIDADRLKAETAALAVEATRAMVLGLVAGSLLDGNTYTAVLSEHVITVLVRAEDGGRSVPGHLSRGLHPAPNDGPNPERNTLVDYDPAQRPSPHPGAGGNG